MSRKEPLTADDWNALYPPGTPCVLVGDMGERTNTKTRSEAWNLGHGQPVVKVEGKTGGWMLGRVIPVQP